MFFWNDKTMTIACRVNVKKCNYHVIFIQFVAGNVTFDDRAENTHIIVPPYEFSLRLDIE